MDAGNRTRHESRKLRMVRGMRIACSLKGKEGRDDVFPDGRPDPHKYNNIRAKNRDKEQRKTMNPGGSGGIQWKV
jgi:hypothetical protein